MRAEAVYVAVCIPDCQCACLDYTKGKWSDAPGPWTTLTHVNTFSNNVMSVPLCVQTQQEKSNFRASEDILPRGLFQFNSPVLL